MSADVSSKMIQVMAEEFKILSEALYNGCSTRDAERGIVCAIELVRVLR